MVVAGLGLFAVTVFLVVDQISPKASFLVEALPLLPPLIVDVVPLRVVDVEDNGAGEKAPKSELAEVGADVNEENVLLLEDVLAGAGDEKRSKRLLLFAAGNGLEVLAAGAAAATGAALWKSSNSSSSFVAAAEAAAGAGAVSSNENRST